MRAIPLLLAVMLFAIGCDKTTENTNSSENDNATPVSAALPKLTVEMPSTPEIDKLIEQSSHTTLRPTPPQVSAPATQSAVPQSHADTEVLHRYYYPVSTTTQRIQVPSVCKELWFRLPCGHIAELCFWSTGASTVEVATGCGRCGRYPVTRYPSHRAPAGYYQFVAASPRGRLFLFNHNYYVWLY